MSTDGPRDTAFEMATSNIRFGSGVTAEVGQDLVELEARRVLVVTDPRLAEMSPVKTVRQSLEDAGVSYELFDQVRVEPTQRSMWQAVEVAKSGGFDSFVAVGGGSAIDTAKVANLYSTYPADFLAYVNAPIGQGIGVPGPLKPLIAIPTTAGTGSETTGVAIFDLDEQHVKTGIAHRRLKPTLGIVDPDHTITMPDLVAASTGLDVLCHALESYTAIPFDQRPRPERPVLRPAYQGSNPVSDIWSERSMAMVARFLQREIRSRDDVEARESMLLASTYAGIGFGNAGVHLCHGMSYPISGLSRDYQPPGYPDDHPLVPHGISVVLTAPSVFRFTAPACPERHLVAASLLGANIDGAEVSQAGDILANRLIELMQQMQLPRGLAALGFTARDIPQLVKGTLPQHRVTKLSPRPADKSQLHAMFEASMEIW